MRKCRNGRGAAAVLKCLERGISMNRYLLWLIIVAAAVILIPLIAAVIRDLD